MTRTTKRGPKLKNNDIRERLTDEQLLFLCCGCDYFEGIDGGPSFPDMETAELAWRIHRNFVIEWATKRRGPRRIWAQQQFDGTPDEASDDD